MEPAADKTVTLTLALPAHKVEVAAFVGLQNGLVEQMRVSALGPVRRRRGLHRGTAFGTIVLHITPESAVGGPLALVRNGDMIRLDVAKRSIDLLVDAAEMEKRRAAVKKFTSKGK